MNDKNHYAPSGCDHPIRIAWIARSDAAAHADAATLDQILATGLPGFAVRSITAATAPAENEADEFDRPTSLVHIWGFGPGEIAALRRARERGIAVTATIDADAIAPPAPAAVGALYRSCDAVLSPNAHGDRALTSVGVPANRIFRFQRGVELDRFSPARYAPDVLSVRAPNAISLVAPHPDDPLLLDALELVRARDPRIRLVSSRETGPDPELYATADLLVVPGFGAAAAEAILAAQASGLPVLAVDTPGARELIENGRSGCLVSETPAALADAIRGLARRAALLDRLATGGLGAVRGHTWEHALEQLAHAWSTALALRDGIGAEVARAA